MLNTFFQLLFSFVIMRIQGPWFDFSITYGKTRRQSKQSNFLCACGIQCEGVAGQKVILFSPPMFQPSLLLPFLNAHCWAPLSMGKDYCLIPKPSKNKIKQSEDLFPWFSKKKKKKASEFCLPYCMCRIHWPPPCQRILTTWQGVALSFNLIQMAFRVFSLIYFCFFP